MIKLYEIPERIVLMSDITLKIDEGYFRYRVGAIILLQKMG